jgi:cysteine synthase A
LQAENQGLLTPRSGDKVYEGTVGSTGVSLAMLCRARGYLAHICIPSDQSIEKSSLLLALGAEVTRVRPASIVDRNQFVNMANDLSTAHTASVTTPGRGYFADQFENPANWEAHYQTTGPEIYKQCGGKIDAFVAGAGTGGTISGVARYLKPLLPNIRVVLADPPGSGLYNRVKFGVMFDVREREGTRRRHQIDTIVEGIGINRLTKNFSVGCDFVDDAVRVSDNEALAMAQFLVENDGLFLGSSSAVNCVAAVRTAVALGPGHRVVTILCDSGARHLSKFWARAAAASTHEDWNVTLDDVLEPGNSKT